MSTSSAPLPLPLPLPWSPTEDTLLLHVIGLSPFHPNASPTRARLLLPSWHAVARALTSSYTRRYCTAPPRPYTVDVVRARWNGHLRPLLLLHACAALGRRIEGVVAEGEVWEAWLAGVVVEGGGEGEGEEGEEEGDADSRGRSGSGSGSGKSR